MSMPAYGQTVENQDWTTGPLGRSRPSAAGPRACF